MQIKIKGKKKRNPFVVIVLQKSVKRHKNKKRDAKMKSDKRLGE